MDIFEFEIRYLSYKWFNSKFSLNFSEDELIDLVKRTNKWQLSKKLNEVTPSELMELTIQTYTNYKIDFLNNKWDIKIGTAILKDYVERLEYELKVVKEMWFNSYFLVVWDYINWAKDNKIGVWPGRWSAAWSLMAYLVGITDIDPLEYDLLFERFLNPARISMPDIDTDFEDTQREQVIEYCKRKYWEEKVALIWTYMSMAAKAAFKDVARTVWMKFDQSNKISNLITEKTIQKTLDAWWEFKELVENNSQVRAIVDLALKLEWTTRQIWVHACWVIIAPEEIVNYTPVQYPPKSWSKSEKDIWRVVSQYDWHFLEDLWLLKMDFLWLRNLSIIKNTIKIIKAQHLRKNLPLPKLFQQYFDTMGFYPDINDSFTYEKTFQVGDTSWVFQFESDWMKNWLKKLKPNNLNDIIAMVALYRPWPMEFIPSYINRKEWKEIISYLPDEVWQQLKNNYWQEIANEEREKLTKDLSPFMDVTFWIPIYQEQLMRIVQVMAWFSLWEADLLRRWVWKKIKEIIDKIKLDFPLKAEAFKWYKHETCIYVFEKMIEPAANYSFNKSHAACYAIIAYQTAYLKAHYPIQFNAALLRSVEEETDKLAKFINELKIAWLKVLPPSVNESFSHCSAIEDTIRIWFLAIKWVWFEVSEYIQNELASNWTFTNLESFLRRCASVINKKSLESLAKSWALDDLWDRKTILYNQKYILDWTKSCCETKQSFWLFDVWAIETKLEFKEIFETNLMEKLMMEYEVFNTFVSWHPFDWLYKYIKWKYNFISQFKDVEDFGEFNIIAFIKDVRKAFNKWFFISLEDVTWQLDIFLKTVLDFSNMDILIITWRKWKSAKVKRVVRLSLEELIQKATIAWKYNPQETIVKVRATRTWDNYLKTSHNQTISDIFSDNVDDDFDETSIQHEQVESFDYSLEWDLDNVDNDDNDKETTMNEIVKIKVPQDIALIRKIINIISQNKWDVDVYINDDLMQISQNWIDEIRLLVDKNNSN